MPLSTETRSCLLPPSYTMNCQDPGPSYPITSKQSLLFLFVCFYITFFSPEQKKKKSIQDITCAEFVQTFEQLNTDNRWWAHFEGRNILETISQIDWLNDKATKEGWRHQLVISVELEKPLRQGIELLIEKVNIKPCASHICLYNHMQADIVFFSKIFAQHHGFKDATSFLRNWNVLNTQLKQK